LFSKDNAGFGRDEVHETRSVIGSLAHDDDAFYATSTLESCDEHTSSLPGRRVRFAASLLRDASQRDDRQMLPAAAASRNGNSRSWGGCRRFRRIVSDAPVPCRSGLAETMGMNEAALGAGLWGRNLRVVAKRAIRAAEVPRAVTEGVPHVVCNS
jgi:hypothetical protein